MPKASPEPNQSDPRVARAILSAPYPLPVVRSRPYFIVRPVQDPTGRQRPPQAVTFVTNPPYFYGLHPGQSLALPAHSGSIRPPGPGGWPLAIATPARPPPPSLQTAEQRLAVERVMEAMQSPVDISDVAGGPLHVAHEIGKLTPGPGQVLGTRVRSFRAVS
jgi:hypothetical protein